LRLHLAGANPHPTVTGLDQLGGVTNYIRGRDASKWLRGIPSYARVAVHDVYPGIDLVYHAAASGDVEYDFVVAPGADPGAIAIDVAGADQVSGNGSGGLSITTAGGELTERAPQIYQGSGGSRRAVSGGFSRRGPNRVGFAVGAHDASRPLVI